MRSRRFYFAISRAADSNASERRREADCTRANRSWPFSWRFGSRWSPGRCDKQHGFRAAVLRNITSRAGQWLSIRLVGDSLKKNSRDAIGARIYVTAEKIQQRKDVISGTSYASQNDLTLHFGLGSARRVDKIEIKWPDGSVQTVPATRLDRKITVMQNKGIVKD